MRDVDKFQSAFLEKLAVYALRRTLTIDDRAALAKLADEAKQADSRIASLVETLVLSELFQKR